MPPAHGIYNMDEQGHVPRAHRVEYGSARGRAKMHLEYGRVSAKRKKDPYSKCKTVTIETILNYQRDPYFRFSWSLGNPSIDNSSHKSTVG